MPQDESLTAVFEQATAVKQLTSVVLAALDPSETNYESRLTRSDEPHECTSQSRAELMLRVMRTFPPVATTCDRSSPLTLHPSSNGLRLRVICPR
jgi:hypothetical protein